MDPNGSLLERTIVKKRQIMEIEKQKPWILLNFVGAVFLTCYL